MILANLVEERQEVFGLLVEINENFTAKDKRIVRKDWNDYFKSLKRHRDVEICNRLSSSYIPIYSVHNLCREFPYNTLIASLYLEGELISPQKHNSVYTGSERNRRKSLYTFGRRCKYRRNHGWL